MSSIDIENRILDAIDTIVKDRVDNAGYDKTIRGVVSKLEDTITGKYLIKYQDSIIEAYSNNLDIKYPEDTLVDILIPNGDFSANKIIINAINRDRLQYNTTVTEESTIEQASGNTIAATQEFGLCSYHSNDIIYLYDKDNDINLINYDKLSFEEYVKENNKILCGAKFRTDLDAEQTKDGNFGIVYEINFKDNLTGAIVTRSYVIDINKMMGSPYNQKIATRQYAIFKIANENFDSVKSIYIFSEGFSKIDELREDKDIFVKDFELYSIRDLTTQELNNYSLSLIKNGKGYFNEENVDTDTVNIQATLKLKGEIVNTQADYYWFINDNETTEKDIDYVKYGGNGWKCINEFSQVDDNNKIWVTSNTNCNIIKAQCKNSSTRVKCVAVKDDEVIAENYISVYNYNPTHEITIVSDQGIQFYFDNGNPTITCLVDKEENNDYTYYWTSEDINKNIVILEETTADNNIYNTARNEYNTLLAMIEGGSVGAAASEERLAELKEIIDSYDYKQRVEKNKIIHVDLSKIVEQTTFRCTVKKVNNIIGSAEITISNTLGLEGEYKLNIINGIQTFNYTYNGTAPNSESLENPIKLKTLAFEIVDPNGKRFSKNILETCDVIWIIPQEETLIIGENSNTLYLNYNLADKFDYKKLNNNNIKLNVKYKNLNLEAQTAFTFVKDGDPGTNATGVVCKIVPNTEEYFSGYATINNGELNYTPTEEHKWFRAQLWENGEKVFDNYNSDEEHEVIWSVLKNSYINSQGQKVTDSSTIEVIDGDFSYLGYDNNAASTVKVEVKYKDTTYYCTYPVIISQTEADYKIYLKENSGFRFVIYASDGKQPQYDNTTPFTIQTEQLIDGYWEDVTNNDLESLLYTWNIKGSIFSVVNDTFVSNINLQINENADLAGNQKFLIPNEDFTGECVNNSIEVKIFNSYLEEIGKIYIPIHMYLDRYGISELNGWDGNKISINDDTGSILAPQVGAGKKESDNTFTGVLIGSVKERQSDEIEQGLFGYSHGQRSIFLDAKTGNAEFGLAGAGRIILDAQSGGKIYGGNYQSGSSGMLIDLATPEIKWGNEKFKVNADGKLSATDVTLTGNITASSGKIGNWNINNGAISNNYTTLTSDGKINASEVNLSGTINATSGRIADYTINGAQLIGNNVGLSGTSGQGWAFWAGSNDPGGAPFHVGHNGEVHCSNLSITGGELNINGRFQVNSSGRLIAKTSGGGQLSMGQYTNHPYVSGLNVGSFGVDMHGAGISNCYTVANGGDLYLASTGGTVHIGHSSGGSGLAIELSGSTTYLNGTIRFVNGETVYVQTSLGYKNLGSLINAAVQHGWIS